jgi:putative ABC transport system substrate-binding protein
MTLKRRDFITLLGGTAAWPVAARAQLSSRPSRVGILDTIAKESNGANLSALEKGLRELGYVEGKNLIIEYRSADGRSDYFPAQVADLVALKVDVIVTRGTPAALAAKNGAGTIPIVMASNGDPLGSGLIASLARPGGNVTGFSALVVELYPKRVELLREMIPGLARMAGLFNMDNPVSRREWEEIAATARSLGIAPNLFEIRNRNAIAPAFEAMSVQRTDGVIVGLDTLTQTNSELIVELAASHRIPAIYSSSEFAGGLLTYGVNYQDLYYRTAAYVEKILHGAKPADLPVQQPTKFELVVNLKTAKALGLTVPPTLLVAADEVIE